ncbi:MAG: PAS-domain containing protein, partial [Marinosulfonomonas sp.]|nr:PAS-domain containing protein [Marinosulfonomonas sp.]
MDVAQAVSKERRARLAAERLLELKQSELFAANARLSEHAMALSDEVVEKREEVEVVRHVAEELRGQNSQALTDLARANHEVEIAERRLWDSVETIQDGFAVFDAASVLVAANSAYLSVFDGMECVAPGITYSEITQILAQEGIVDIGAQDPQLWCQEMQQRWISGELGQRTLKLWNGLFIKLVDRRAENGDTVSLALNITDTIRREKQLTHARSKAEAANRAKSSFLAKMSHELRTPMNGVVGMADLLTDTELSEEQTLFVETIKSSGEALLGLINDVLDFSKIEAEKLVLHSE